jgi:hypothetical protein
MNSHKNPLVVVSNYEHHIYSYGMFGFRREDVGIANHLATLGRTGAMSQIIGTDRPNDSLKYERLKLERGEFEPMRNIIMCVDLHMLAYKQYTTDGGAIVCEFDEVLRGAFCDAEQESGELFKLYQRYTLLKPWREITDLIFQD